MERFPHSQRIERERQLMRKNVTLILILLIIIPVFGFWKETPEDVLIKFLKSLYSNNLKKTLFKVNNYEANTYRTNENI